ncbi:hypothetical protein D9613_006083 [Agrocybe pediades]|uniref:Uncharacterized protein n=1 Tax=Agrocybe pediades TaxID=84607 RepID=A0A8H4QVA1_9AGAR|nr:hypothetical protein D9613_006083 [Agrocybe pediades]
MSVNSLPSFNETFNSSHSRSLHNNTNALPPIIHSSSRKRSNDDDVRVKDESDDDQGAPPPSSLIASPHKKRRVTVSGAAPHPLNVDVRAAPDQASSTPISPVVMGFTIQRDNPTAIEQVRSMISVKQKQKAIIEQRRGSAAGIVSSASGETPASRNNNNANTPRRPPPSPKQTSLHVQQQQQQQAAPPAPAPPQPQHSLLPPPISFARRRAALMGGKKKPADIVISPREAHTRDQLQPAIQSAPPIPQAGGQSAFYTGRFQMALPRLPNISGDNPRRVATNVPPTPTRLSTSLAIQQQERGSFVQQIHNSSINAGVNHTPSNRSPPAPSVPISHAAMVPPTPTSLHRPGYQGDKAAFLAPFDMFYDALNDSKQLKVWLGDQLHKSQALVQSLTLQQEKMGETIDALVEKKLSGMKAEMAGLRRRVEDLEETLHRSQQQQRRGSFDHHQQQKQHYQQQQQHHQSQQQQNGVMGPSHPDAMYTFPSVSDSTSSNTRLRPDLTKRTSSPGWQQQQQQQQQQQLHRGPAPNSDRDRDQGNGNGAGRGGGNSPDARRVSSIRQQHDLPPPQHPAASTSTMQSSPPLPYRERERERDRNPDRDREREQGLSPTPPSTSRIARPAPLSRHGSSHTSGVPLPMLDRDHERDRENREKEREWERERERERDRDDSTNAASRRPGSRRNSVSMADPDKET